MISYDDPDKITAFLVQDGKNIVESFQEHESLKGKDWIYVFLILRMLQLQDCEDEQNWQEFKEEILHKNRYFPQSDIFEKIRDIAPYATRLINSNTVLYRCREYENKDFFDNIFVKSCINFIKDELPDMSIEESDFRNSAKVEIILNALFLKPGIADRIKEKYSILKEGHDSFWGFDKKGSDAPQESMTRSMRANPEGISYLYTAEDVNTTLMEMRPQLGRAFSVATIRIREDIKVFDFIEMDTVGEGQKIFSQTILDKMFSDPNYGDPLDYVPTQCICEFIKQLGFDGIRYHSSLSQDGKNVVLFNIEPNKKKYVVEGSEVYVVGDIKIDYTRVLPLPKEIIEQ